MNSISNTRRALELGLLCASAIPTTLLYVLYIVNAHIPLTIATLAVPIGLFVAFAICHIAVRIYAPAADPVILPLVFLLSGVGIAFVTRLAPSAAINQIIWLFISVAALVCTLIFVPSIHDLANYKFTLGVAGILLLVAPMIIGTELGGSKLWITFGGFSFQPGELAKILIILFLAFFLAENREILSATAISWGPIQLPRPRMLAPLLIMWCLSLLVVVFERDLGSALLFFSFFVVMLYVCTGKVSYVVISCVLLIAGGVLCYHLFSHVQVRVDMWLNPFSDPSNKGLQIVQSLYSLADGGMVGAGIGRGLPTLIPVVASDFIFSAIGEELGFLGASSILLCFVLLAVRGFTTAARAKSDVAAFAAAGLCAALVIQAFIIVAGTTKLLPLTGVTLPFMSQGGSSLLASFITVGLLLKAGDEGTGRSAQIDMTNQGQSMLKSFGSKLINSKLANNPHVRAHFALDTPESGVLGRVALGRRLVHLLGACCVLFALLITNLTYVQIVDAQRLQSLPSNNHTIKKNSHIKRGAIISSDGVTLAESVQQEDGHYERSYPNGNLAAHTLGYVSLRYGTSGIEARLNDTLISRKNYSSIADVVYSMAGIAKPGPSAVLTINSQMQKAAQAALKGYTGSIVAINPTTGAILAKASSPSYNLQHVGEALKDESGTGSLIDRSTHVLYAPGSTFKVVTLAAALESGAVTLSSKFNAPAKLTVDGAQITNYKNEDFGTISVKDALSVSSNTAFAQIGAKVGADKLVNYARAFGYGTPLGIDFSTRAALMPKPEEMTGWELAWAACGQPVGMHESPAGPQSTTMQNAVVAATIANSGIAMNPFVVDHLLTSEGASIAKTTPRTLQQVISAQTADTLKEAMLYVVEKGIGQAARINGVKVAGKTGTAEVSPGVAHSHFIGFAPFDQPTVAIAVTIEGAPGRDVHGKAAAIAGKVLAACLNIQALGAAK